MIERKVLALWLAVALLLAAASGAITYAALSDEETVSVEISASAAANAPDDGHRLATRAPAELVEPSEVGLRERTGASRRGDRP